MTTNTNQNIQKLINEADAIDPNDTNLETKLTVIAQKVAQEQQKARSGINTQVNNQDLIDPGDAFACEGCQ
jgi:hypothetical protein